MKNTSFILAAATALSAAGFAGDCGCCSCESCCVPKPKKCIDCECYTPAYHDLQCDWGFFLDIEFLYWYGRETNLPLGYKAKSVHSDPAKTQVAIVPITTEYIGISWDPGVRGGLGWNGCDGWDLSLYWTYFKNTKNGSASVEGGWERIGDRAGIIGLKSPWFLNDQIANNREQYNLSGRWQFLFNSLDVEMGRRYLLSRCFTLRPYAGIKAAWTETEFSSNLSKLGIPVESGTEDIRSNNAFKNKFIGAGLMGGLQPTWYFSLCFGLYADVNLSILWGKYEREKDGSNFLQTSLDGVMTDYSYKAKSDFHGMQAVLDAGIGLRWEDTWCCDRYRTSIDLGWEHQIWFDHNHRFLEIYERDQAFETNHNVGFGGLVVRARFDF